MEVAVVLLAYYLSIDLVVFLIEEYILSGV